MQSSLESLRKISAPIDIEAVRNTDETGLRGCWAANQSGAKASTAQPRGLSTHKGGRS
jgi:hypothetical protein